MSESHGMYSIFGEKLKVVGPPKKSGKKTNGHGRKFLPPRPLYPKPLADGINKKNVLFRHQEMRPAILPPAILVTVKAEGFFLAVTDYMYPAIIDSLGGQV